eukprot:4950525-Amphidinium_carterae.1
MPIALCAKTGFQAPKVRSRSGNLSEQDSSRVPLNFVVCLTPSEVLVSTAPAAFCRCPGKTVSQKTQVPYRPSAPSSVKGSFPDLSV